MIIVVFVINHLALILYVKLTVNPNHITFVRNVSQQYYLTILVHHVQHMSSKNR